MTNLHVFGIRHIEEEKKAAVKALSSHNVTRLGVEQLHDPIVFDNSSTDIFWRSINFHAKKVGITLVALEGSERNNALLAFQGLIAGILIATNLQGTDAWRSARKNIGEISKKKKQLIPESIKKKVLQMIAEAAKHQPQPTREDLTNLFDAVSVTRSLQMYDRALQEKLEYALVGTTHMQHLALLRGVKATVLSPSEFVHEVPQRTDQYFRHEELMKRLRAISEGRI